MAGEIRAQLSLRVTKGNFDDSIAVSISADQAGVGGGNPGIVDIGTTDEPITAGDLASTKGHAVFRNLDDTNYVDIGPESNGVIVPTMRLKPGEFGYLPLVPDVTLRARANTAACRVMVKIYDA